VYSRAIEIDLSEIEPMIALPFHPGNAFPIRELNEHPMQVLEKAEAAAGLKNGELRAKWTDKGLRADQFVIAGCAGGTYENILNAARILGGKSAGNTSIYPSSVPVEAALMKDGALMELITSGAVLKPCFCGPCFGAGDVPSNGALSLRHTTRNFPCREGSKPGEGQSAYVALMDARSIAASALTGYVTGADTIDYEDAVNTSYTADLTSYKNRVYNGWGKPLADEPLVFGPNIADWPKFEGLKGDLRYTVASRLTDAVTTTDELIRSGETSSYRSNPARLSEFALSRRDPEYVKRSKALRDSGTFSAVAAVCPGDGSAREQAASCQRVLGGIANIAVSYATKRYRANLINWGIVPFICPDALSVNVGDVVEVKDFATRLENGEREFTALVNGSSALTLSLPLLTDGEAEILLDGCLINHYGKVLEK